MVAHVIPQHGVSAVGILLYDVHQILEDFGAEGIVLFDAVIENFVQIESEADSLLGHLELEILLPDLVVVPLAPNADLRSLVQTHN